jgi:hypothetical protein
MIVEWEIIEPNPPEPGQPPDYVWGPYHDIKLRLVAEAGVRLIATVVDALDWAASVPCAPIYPDRLDEFARFLTDLVNRYKGPPTISSTGNCPMNLTMTDPKRAAHISALAMQARGFMCTPLSNIKRQ